MAERFRREGYFANSIGHPGVVRAIDDDVAEDGCAFIVMELLEGENLEERRVRLGGRVPIADALQIADAILDVLSAAHDHEVLHRDLKPENVFITRKNEVKLLDFGVARFNDGRSSSDMTAVGMVLGTPAFMPPEQALGRREDVDARSDIWSVGATLFTVMAGESVHAGGDAKAKLIATARSPARPVRNVVPEVPPAIAAVIDRALAFDRVERWADAKAMREALQLARKSRDGQVPSLDGTDSIVPPLSRREEEEPTLARAVQRRFDETKPRAPVVSISSGPASSDGVFTSAPPVTRREASPTFPQSEGPTFSLRADATRRASEFPPSTERLPPQMVVATPTVAIPSSAPTVAYPSGLVPTALSAGSAAPPSPHQPMAAPTPVTPRPTSAKPFAASPETGAPLGPPSAHTSVPSIPSKPTGTVMMPAAGTAPSSRPPGYGHPVVHPRIDAAGYPHRSAPPRAAMQASAPPGIAPSAPFASGRPPAEPAGQHWTDSGATRSNVQKGGAARLLVPLLIGLLAAGGMYAAVTRKALLRKTHFSLGTNATAPAESAPKTGASASASASATPPSSALPIPATADSITLGHAAPSASPEPSAEPAPTATATATASAPPKKKHRPKPIPTAGRAS